MSPVRDPAIQRAADERARRGRTERRILVTYDTAARAEVLAGSKGRQAFSDLINMLMVAAEERIAAPDDSPLLDKRLGE